MQVIDYMDKNKWTYIYKRYIQLTPCNNSKLVASEAMSYAHLYDILYRLHTLFLFECRKIDFYYPSPSTPQRGDVDNDTIVYLDCISMELSLLMTYSEPGYIPLYVRNAMILGRLLAAPKELSKVDVEITTFSPMGQEHFLRDLNDCLYDISKLNDVPKDEIWISSWFNINIMLIRIMEIKRLSTLQMHYSNCFWERMGHLLNEKSDDM